MNKDRIAEITSRLLSNASTLKYGTVSVSLKIHDSGIVETSYTTSECTKEKESKREINPEWGKGNKGILDIQHEILS